MDTIYIKGLEVCLSWGKAGGKTGWAGFLLDIAMVADLTKARRA